MPVVKRQKKCTECQRLFANPESFRRHKNAFGYCRSEESLILVGYENTKAGWKQVKYDFSKRKKGNVP